jgi:PAS domain S-box-containing protein
LPHSSEGAGLSAEVRLTLSQEALGLATEMAEIGTWDVDVQTGALIWPDRTRAMFGISPGAPCTLDDFYAGLHPDDREATAWAFASALDPDLRATYDVEYRTIGREDGRIRHVVARGKGIFDADGVCRRAVGAVMDVSAQREAQAFEQALLTLSDRFRLLDDPDDIAHAAAEILGRTLDAAHAGYGLVDREAETIDVARGWSAPGRTPLPRLMNFRDYGSYIDDLKQGQLVVFSDARQDPRTRDTAEALVSIGAISGINLPVTEEDGFVALLYIASARVRDWTPEEIGLAREVSNRAWIAIERRRAEQALVRLNATLESRVESEAAERNRLWSLSQDPFLVADAQGVWLAVSPAWTEILGWSEKALLGRTSEWMEHPEDRAKTRSEIDHLAGGGATLRFENRFRAKDGTYRWFTWTAVPDGDLMYCVARDTTREKAAEEALARAEEQLRQSQKMEAVGQLTGGIAHDFNNLLTGISGSLELLESRLAQGRTGEVGRYIAAAQGASRRAAALTHRLLAFSRRQTLDPTVADANRLIAELEDLFRRTVGPAVELEVAAADDLWPVKVDVNQLENAVLNLCINARDAMPGGGRLTIATANRRLDEAGAAGLGLAAGEYVTIAVSDTGVGMTPDVAAKAFDPFFTTKPLGLGTGLGLSMIYGFVRQSGGQAGIETRAGEGTTVTLYLPRRTGEPLAAVNGGDAQIPGHGAGETVLVVDDEPTVRMLVLEVLAEFGYQGVEAADGAEGLAILQSDRRIDLLVTDVGLPGGMNGRQMADAARVRRQGLKVLFITGYAESAAVGDGSLDAGMHVMTKPFAMEALAARIKTLIS